MRLVTAEEMAAMDREAIFQVGIPGAVLMENAGRGAVEIMRRHFPDLGCRRVLVIAGGGNNGGDGFVVARYLWQEGVAVRVCCLKPAAAYRGEARINLEVLFNLDLPVAMEVSPATVREEIASADLIVDAIFGTGLKSEIRGVYGEVIELINQSGKPVFAVDLPSGLDATTGNPLGSCIRAEVTATFGFAKVGQVVTPGCTYVGKLEIIDIGIPRSITVKAHPSHIYLDQQEVAPMLPSRAFASHKGTYGHCLVVAGSVGKTGAAALASLGAARAGAGLVTLAVPSSLHDLMEVKLTEVMTEPLPETTERTLGRAAVARILELAANKEALVLGPGLSTHPETREMVRAVVTESSCPLVIDADGVNCLAGDLKTLERLRAPAILTPHPGEMARLLGVSPAEVQGQRLQVTRSFCRQFGVVLVLKGARTLIGNAAGLIAVNGSGNPGLASGGTGDVLTGLIGGLWVQGLDGFAAACLGVFTHGAAADRVACRVGVQGMMAGDLLGEIPAVFAELAQSGASVAARPK